MLHSSTITDMNSAGLARLLPPNTHGAIHCHVPAPRAAGAGLAPGRHCGAVLGALPLSARVEEEAMVRLAEGVRLHRALPGTTLVTSGGGSQPTMARTMADLSRAWGVEDVAVHDDPANTHAEAQAAARAFGDERFLLVTSASHMPRAMALFRGAGLDPIAAPTQHMAPAMSAQDVWSVRYLRPGATGLRKMVAEPVIGRSNTPARSDNCCCGASNRPAANGEGVIRHSCGCSRVSPARQPLQAPRRFLLRFGNCLT
ncbi:MAG: hypothetical protein FKY71_13105 [Spiribacter salinus]|uniref:DUF218 domain-containing protein n=1 Tax=Spiribacter salinus TaxID=1335746 RepID=A0A540VP80_9GAMM|nr:MAG: hypothetical protein FKY71_13105 [Spiribacter salinus]